jgi:hypothetical protein
MPLWRAAHGELAQRLDPAKARRLAKDTDALD